MAPRMEKNKNKCNEHEENNHRKNCMKNTDSYNENCPDNYEKQMHTHEFLGSTQLAELEEDPHNHRFAGVTGEAIKYGKNHYHELKTNTDFVDHFHVVKDKTELATPVGDGKHVHFVMGTTTERDNHTHDFIFATLIESPLIPDNRKQKDY